MPSEKKIPFFKAPNQPQLEKALNKLVERVNGMKNVTVLGGKPHIGVTPTADGEFTVSLLEDPRVPKDVRYLLDFDEKEGKLYVGVGHLAFIPKEKGIIEPITPTIKVEDKKVKLTDSVVEDGVDTGQPPYLLTGGEGTPDEQWILVQASDDKAEVILHDTSQELPKVKKGEFYFQVGIIRFEDGKLLDDEDGEEGLEQVWESDIELPLVETDSSSPSSSDPSSSEPSSSESSDESSKSSDEEDSSDDADSSDDDGGSDKSTAIVKSSWNEAYTALFVAEMPEVRFDDVLIVEIPKGTSRKFVTPIDPKFVEVCQKGTIEAVGYTTYKPVSVGIKVSGSVLEIHLPFFNRPDRIVVRLSAIRKGFPNHRFPDRSKVQFEANERFIKSAYPGS